MDNRFFNVIVDVAKYNRSFFKSTDVTILKEGNSLEKLAIDLLMAFIKYRVQRITENNFRGLRNDVRDSLIILI